MRHTFFVLAASAVLAAISGCACNNCCNSCNSGMHRAAASPQQSAQPAQQAGSGGVVSYPYYTDRGPRDFLETHPQSIGP
jgi:hypothetical protein